MLVLCSANWCHYFPHRRCCNHCWWRYLSQCTCIAISSSSSTDLKCSRGWRGRRRGRIEICNSTCLQELDALTTWHLSTIIYMYPFTTTCRVSNHILHPPPLLKTLRQCGLHHSLCGHIKGTDKIPLNKGIWRFKNILYPFQWHSLALPLYSHTRLHLKPWAGLQRVFVKDGLIRRKSW